MQCITLHDAVRYGNPVADYPTRINKLKKQWSTHMYTQVQYWILDDAVQGYIIMQFIIAHDASTKRNKTPVQIEKGDG